MQRDPYWKAAAHLLPVLFVAYIVNFLDRVSVSFAELSMGKALGMGPAAYGTAAGMFFLGYLLFEIPSNLMLYRFGARVWLARIVLSWGFVIFATAFVRSAEMLYILRFLLGVVEAGFFPGVLFYLTLWFPSHLRARMTSLFMIAVPAAGIVGGPFFGVTLQTMDGVWGLQGWEWLFLLLSIPCFGVCVWIWLGLPNSPAAARWLSPEEKTTIQSDLEREATTGESSSQQRHDWSASLRQLNVWKLCFVYFLAALALYGLTFWLPQLIKELGWKEPAQIGLVSVIPWSFAIVSMYLVGRSSDQRQERRLHVIVSAGIGAAGYLGCAIVRDPWLDMVFISFAAAGTMSLYPALWAIPMTVLKGAAAASGIALINSLGNAGGFVSPILIGWVVQEIGSAEIAQAIPAVGLVLTALVLALCPSLEPSRWPTQAKSTTNPA